MDFKSRPVGLSPRPGIALPSALGDCEKLPDRQPGAARVRQLSPAPEGVPSFASATRATDLQASSAKPALPAAPIWMDASDELLLERPLKRQRKNPDVAAAKALQQALRGRTDATPLYDLVLAQVHAGRAVPLADRPALLAALLRVVAAAVPLNELCYATVCLGRAFRNDAAGERRERREGKSAETVPPRGSAWVRQALDDAARSFGAEEGNQILWGRAILHFTMDVFLLRYRPGASAAPTAAGPGPLDGWVPLYDVDGLRLLERVLAIPGVTDASRVARHLSNIADYGRIRSPGDRWAAAELVCRSAPDWVPGAADFVRDSLRAHVAAWGASDSWPQPLVEAANAALIRIFLDGMFRLGLPRPPESTMSLAAMEPLQAFLEDARASIAPGVPQATASPEPAVLLEAGGLGDTGPQAPASPNPFQQTLDFLAEVAAGLGALEPADGGLLEPPANEPQ